MNGKRDTTRANGAGDPAGDPGGSFARFSYYGNTSICLPFRVSPEQKSIIRAVASERTNGNVSQALRILVGLGLEVYRTAANEM